MNIVNLSDLVTVLDHNTLKQQDKGNMQLFTIVQSTEIETIAVKT